MFKAEESAVRDKADLRISIFACAASVCSCGTITFAMQHVSPNQSFVGVTMT
ncbi:hypothetical protein SAMN04488042_11176 [Shimia aestuarii]|uniref:Uncharacterized protein n=1 Tax=Shimia aestuarii TaxID=254406 RepID=A0A1I4SMA6_9RHOB|nr:hypothetical protein SAMN04488042_11176 [Shimia aestuarii]